MDSVLKGMIDIQKKTAHDLGALEAARHIIEIAEELHEVVNVDDSFPDINRKEGVNATVDTLISKIKQDYNLT